MNTRRILLIGLIAGIAVAAFLAYRTYNRPHRDIAAEQAAFQLEAGDLFDDFEADEPAANELYLDRVVEVTGVVESVQTNSDGQTVLMLTAENALAGGVSATLAEDGEMNSAVGDRVTVKCRCTGFLMDVVLVDCSLIKPVQ